MSLQEKLINDMKQAMKSGEKFRLSTLRLLFSALKNEAIAKRAELTNEEVITIVQREVKQRKNAIEEFKKGNRDDLVKQAEEEVAILEVYLPQQISDEELEALVRQVITEQNVSSLKEMGKVMGKLMPQVKGKADGNRVQNTVKKILT